MKKVKAEVVLLGSGSAVLMAAQRLSSLGTSFVVVNPLEEFGIGDIRPYDGLGLWNAAYRGVNQGSQSQPSLADLYELLENRVRESFPAPLDQTSLRRAECWSVLSTTPVHEERTRELEKEFFKIERKRWSSGHFRLVNPDHVNARFRKIDVNVSDVAQVEGAVVRSYAIWWDAARMGLLLNQSAYSRFADRCFTKMTVLNRFGRRLVLRDSAGEELSVEAEKGIFIFLTGEILPHLKNIVASCSEPWIQGVRKRRREEHLAWFETPYSSEEDEFVLMELGDTTYRWTKKNGVAVWSVRRGPDGLDRVVDEALRLHGSGEVQTRYTYSVREFFLEWDWKMPLWKETSHDTFWATSFEGDLFKVTELLWNFPRH